MKKAIIVGILTIFLIGMMAGCTEDNELIKGSGDITTIEKDFKDFIKIELTMGFQATIVQSNTTSITLKVDDNVEKYLEVKKEGDTLSISLDEDKSYKDLTLNANITLPDLTYLSLSGGCHATVKGFNFQHDFECNAAGGSSASMIGNGGKLKISASGGSNVDFGYFPSGNTEVDLSGGSRATVRVNGSLEGSVSGGSNLYYYGNPTNLDVSTSDGSQVTKMD